MDRPHGLRMDWFVDPRKANVQFRTRVMPVSTGASTWLTTHSLISDGGWASSKRMEIAFVRLERTSAS